MSSVKNKINFRLTKHGIKRLKQRCQISKTQASKHIIKVYKFGLSYDELPKAVQEHTKHVRTLGRKDNCIRVYGDKLFIFTKSAFITVLYLPTEFIADVVKLQKGKK